jgi:hypothetical protein
MRPTLPKCARRPMRSARQWRDGGCATVIPAKAGTHLVQSGQLRAREMDPRLRRDDELADVTNISYYHAISSVPTYGDAV